MHLSAAVIGKALVVLLLGGVVAAAGTVMHRAIQPWGVLLALLLVLAGGFTARAWAGLVSLVGYAAGVFLVVQALSQVGPGGDVLVPGGQAIGWVWVLGAVAALVVVGLAPRRWFDDRPLPPRPRRPATDPVPPLPPGTSAETAPHHDAVTPAATPPHHDAASDDRP